MPRFSVLLPVHRPPVLLPFAIETVRAQSVADFELLVVCDGAPDETAGCAHAFGTHDSRVKTLVFPKGERHGEAHRHTALMQASGSMVAHICDDDLWLPNHLEESGRLLAEADFGHVFHTAVVADGSLRVNACDLADPVVRDRFVNETYNRFGPTSCTYRLEAYRRLSEGWSPAPPGVWTDLHMWRKFLRRNDLSFTSRAAVTTLHFPDSLRPGMSLADRAAENQRWYRRIQNASERSRIAEQAINYLAVLSIRQELELIALRTRLAGSGATKVERQAKIDRLTLDLAILKSTIERSEQSNAWRLTAALRGAVQLIWPGH